LAHVACEKLFVFLYGVFIWKFFDWIMEKIIKMRKVMTAIATSPPTKSFAAIIEEEREAFMGLDVVYATRAHDSYIQQVRLDQIEAACPLVTSLFNGSGLLFYSDRIYRDMEQGAAQIMLDFSIGLDKNVCENLRCYVNNKGFSKIEEMRRLMHLMRGSGENGFNYDFLAYLVEEYEHMFVLGNDRPFDTLYALKVLDHLDQTALARFPSISVTPSTRDYALAAAQETLAFFLANGSLASMQEQRQVGYLVLLKALLLHWAGKTADVTLGELTRFCIEEFGKFPKREIYFAWKLLGGDGNQYRFFAPAVQRTQASLKNLRGISWDLTMLRWAELMSSSQRRHSQGVPDFFVPFVASTDQRFRDMVAACPLKAIVIDRKGKMLNSIFYDEYAFQACVHEQMERVGARFGDSKNQARRHTKALPINRVEQLIALLEGEVQAMLPEAINR
jgi:hypothetical protein